MFFSSLDAAYTGHQSHFKKQPPSHRGGRGGFSGGGPARNFQPHPYNAFPPPSHLHPGNENFNPQFQQFRSQMERAPSLLITPRPPLNGSPQQSMQHGSGGGGGGGPPMMAPQFIRGHIPHQQQMPPHNFRPPYANEMNRQPRMLGPPNSPLIQHLPLHGGAGHRIPRGDFSMNSVPPPFRSFNGNQPMRPNGPPMLQQHRPRMQPNQQQFMPPRMQQQYAGPSGHPMQIHHGGPSSSTQPTLTPQPMRRKVLINPNFKGGVEAATSK